MPSSPQQAARTKDDPVITDDGAHEHGTPIVELTDVYKSFGANKVLEGISLRFQQGKTTVVLGPSGAGKSVILKHIAGLLRPDSGQVLFRGKPIHTLSEHALAPVRRQMGYLFQQSALFDSMTILENLEFPLIEHMRMSPNKRRRVALDALTTVDLHNVENKRPGELSGGQQKRAALARAIILEPALILYDEPTTGLDPVRAEGINALITRLQSTLGVSSIVVTHDLACMQRVADRVVVLYDGSIHFDGSPEALHRADDPVVRRFVETAFRTPTNGNSLV